MLSNQFNEVTKEWVPVQKSAASLPPSTIEGSPSQSGIHLYLHGHHITTLHLICSYHLSINRQRASITELFGNST